MVSGPASLVSGQGLASAIFIVTMILGCLAIVRRAPGPAVYGLTLIAAAVALGVWHTMPRLAVCGFPAFAGIALLMPRTRLVLLLGFGFIQAVFVYLIVAGPVNP